MNPNTSLRIKIIAAFAAVYIIWGSTYLAIHYAIGTIPPLLMAGGRFAFAGALLFLWARFRSGAALPSFTDFKKASLIGALLLLGGNGMVVLAERTVPSGLTALLIATEPLMIVLLEWLRPGGKRPVGGIAFGLLLGFAGVVFLIGPSGFSGETSVDIIGAVMLMIASLSWAIGSLYASRANIHSAPLMTAAVQMLSGGALLIIAGCNSSTKKNEPVPDKLQDRLSEISGNLMSRHLIDGDSAKKITAGFFIARCARRR